MTGHPSVVDNELRVPDLEPTIETSNFLVKLGAAIGGNTTPKLGTLGTGHSESFSLSWKSTISILAV